MFAFEVDGKRYHFACGKWFNPNSGDTSKEYQDEVNSIFKSYLDSYYKKRDFNSLIKIGNNFKSNNLYQLAVTAYKKVVCCGDYGICKSVYPRLASCFRALGQPQKTVNLATYIKETHGTRALTIPILISVASAYCDLHDYNSALQCVRVAKDKIGNENNAVINRMYQRIYNEKDYLSKNNVDYSNLPEEYHNKCYLQSEYEKELSQYSKDWLYYSDQYNDELDYYDKFDYDENENILKDFI